MTTDLGWVGYAPTLTVARDPDFERKKYERMWKHDAYRAVAPGEHCVAQFIAQARPKPGTTVIDFGCGTGRAALMLNLLSGVKVHMLDFASNSLDDDIKEMLKSQAHVLSFTQHDLTQPLNFTAPYGFCTDVMEHIPEDQVDQVLRNILSSAQHVFFQIAFFDDICGREIGEPLHLTVRPFTWWLDKFKSLDCAIHWSADNQSSGCFYVTCWQDSKKLIESAELNIDEQQIVANVRENLLSGWKQVVPHETNDLECIVLGGGPSLNRHIDEIRALRASGAKLITLNGTYNWAIQNGLVPSATVMVDARPFNARFVEPVVDKCVYLIASQCDPSVFANLPHERTYVWHTSSELVKPALDEHYKDEPWYGVPGGTTVLLRAIPLMRMLGYTKFHLFGCDSCVTSDGHHAYEQPENDDQIIIPLSVGGRTFNVQPWHAHQANEFIEMVRFMADDILLEIYGDGLLAHILRTGAELDTTEA